MYTLEILILQFLYTTFDYTSTILWQQFDHILTHFSLFLLLLGSFQLHLDFLLRVVFEHFYRLQNDQI